MTKKARRNLPIPSPHRQQGLTLIEILVAVVILSIGLLGLAGLQVLGLKNISISGTHANAAILTNELVERIHLNSDNIAGYQGLGDGSCSGSLTTIAQIDYCTVYGRASGDVNLNGSIDDGETRLLRPFSGTDLIKIEDCASCDASTAPGAQTITVSWAEQDFNGDVKERTYSFNFNP
jgi:type IV pilus assembly protein PilV